jgi:hypothetical protein
VLAADAEGIALLETKGDELAFVVVVEDRSDAIGMSFDDRTPGAALVIRPRWESKIALVSSIWEFKLSEEHAIRPYGGDTNRGFEGIAIDHHTNRGYLAYEQASDGKPRLFTFEIPETNGNGPERIPVVIEPVALAFDFTPAGKPETDLNFNGLALLRTEGESAMLLILCRNRELLLVLTLTDPKTAVLHEQVGLDLLSPIGQSITWVSPEGIAIDEENHRLYVVSDPDPSCGGNWKASQGGELHEGRRAAEVNLFLQFVPLLFELDAAAVIR